jgi:mRNA interferase YafQ
MEERIVHTTNKFEKDVALAIRRGKNTQKLKAVIGLLVARQPLPPELKDHSLKGAFNDTRDVRIEPDWVLIYKVDNQNVWLIRTGTHADLFGN